MFVLVFIFVVYSVLDFVVFFVVRRLSGWRRVCWGGLVEDGLSYCRFVFLVCLFVVGAS